MLRGIVAGFAGVVLSAGVVGAAETKVTMEKTHLCCNQCVKGAEKAAKSAGATAQCDKDAGTVTITAADEATAQKAVDALSNAGYYGKTTGASIKDNESPAGKVKSASVSGIHNCCQKCTKSINEVIKKVPGAQATVPLKAVTFTVNGDFDVKQLVQAFHDAGFQVKVAGQ